MEQLDIRRASDEFADQVEEYRKYFRARAPFAVAEAELKLQHVRHINRPPMRHRKHGEAHSRTFQHARCAYTMRTVPRPNAVDLNVMACNLQTTCGDDD